LICISIQGTDFQITYVCIQSKTRGTLSVSME